LTYKVTAHEFSVAFVDTFVIAAMDRDPVELLADTPWPITVRGELPDVDQSDGGPVYVVVLCTCFVTQPLRVPETSLTAATLAVPGVALMPKLGPIVCAPENSASAPATPVAP
jgi:hypothetical protein